jgi:hypothetical protein
MMREEAELMFQFPRLGGESIAVYLHGGPTGEIKDLLSEEGIAVDPINIKVD